MRKDATGRWGGWSPCVHDHRWRKVSVRPRDSLDQQHASSIKLPSCAAVFVKSLYYHVLQRAAGEAEVQAWLGFLGVVPGQVEYGQPSAPSSTAPDFRAIAVTPSSYVTALHRVALGQDSDSERLALHPGDPGALPHASPLVPGSPEFKAARAQVPADALVAHFFQEALGRAASPVEIQVGTQYLNETEDISPGLAAVLNSEEFTRTPRTFAQHVRSCIAPCSGETRRRPRRRPW
jgi:hypothetical protein